MRAIQNFNPKSIPLTCHLGMRRGISVAEGWGGGDEPMSEGGMGAKEVTHRATRWRGGRRRCNSRDRG